MNTITSTEAVWTSAMASEDRPSRLLDADDVAAITGLRTSAIYRLAREHRIPTVRLGRYYRFRPEAVAQWLEGLEA